MSASMIAASTYDKPPQDAFRREHTQSAGRGRKAHTPGLGCGSRIDGWIFSHRPFPPVTCEVLAEFSVYAINQRKGCSNQPTVEQLEQGPLWYRERLPDLICRPVLIQFAEVDLIGMFEVTMEDDEMKVVQERHYRLVPASEGTLEDPLWYRNST